jgi:hypothetical protein
MATATAGSALPIAALAAGAAASVASAYRPNIGQPPSRH